MKKRRRAGIGIASFIIRLPVIFLAPVTLHDLGGFSLRSRALWDKTVQIEFDSYRLLYSAVNLVFAIETHTSVSTLAVFVASIWNSSLFILLHLSSSPHFVFFFFILLQTMKIKKRISFSRYLNADKSMSSTPAASLNTLNTSLRQVSLEIGHHRVEWMSDRLL